MWNSQSYMHLRGRWFPWKAVIRYYGSEGNPIYLRIFSPKRICVSKDITVFYLPVFKVFLCVIKMHKQTKFEKTNSKQNDHAFSIIHFVSPRWMKLNFDAILLKKIRIWRYPFVKTKYSSFFSCMTDISKVINWSIPFT